MPTEVTKYKRVWGPENEAFEMDYIGQVHMNMITHTVKITTWKPLAIASDSVQEYINHSGFEFIFYLTNNEFR